MPPPLKKRSCGGPCPNVKFNKRGWLGPGHAAAGLADWDHPHPLSWRQPLQLHSSYSFSKDGALPSRTTVQRQHLTSFGNSPLKSQLQWQICLETRNAAGNGCEQQHLWGWVQEVGGAPAGASGQRTTGGPWSVPMKGGAECSPRNPEGCHRPCVWHFHGSQPLPGAWEEMRQCGCQVGVHAMWARSDGNVCRGDKPRTSSPRIARMWSPEQPGPEGLQRHLRHQVQRLKNLGRAAGRVLPFCKSAMAFATTVKDLLNPAFPKLI